MSSKPAPFWANPCISKYAHPVIRFIQVNRKLWIPQEGWRNSTKNMADISRNKPRLNSVTAGTYYACESFQYVPGTTTRCNDFHRRGFRGEQKSFRIHSSSPHHLASRCVAIQQVRGDQMPRIRDCFLTGLINYSAQAYPWCSFPVGANNVPLLRQRFLHRYRQGSYAPEYCENRWFPSIEYQNIAV